MKSRVLVTMNCRSSGFDLIYTVPCVEKHIDKTVAAKLHHGIHRHIALCLHLQEVVHTNRDLSFDGAGCGCGPARCSAARRVAWRRSNNTTLPQETRGEGTVGEVELHWSSL